MAAASLFQVKVPSGKGEYIAFVEDVMRMATIQIVIQLLMAAQGVASVGMDFVVYLLQVMVGVATYWLVVRRVVNVRGDARPFGAIF